MFLGSDLPANFSGQYFSAYAQDRPDSYPFTVGSEVYKFNQALVDRFYLTGNEVSVGGYEDVVNTSAALREMYVYEAAKRAPFLARCDVVSSQIYCESVVVIVFSPVFLFSHACIVCDI